MTLYCLFPLPNRLGWMATTGAWRTGVRSGMSLTLRSTIHEMGIEVQAEYEDEGLNFAGEYAHGEDKSWEPTALDDERWEPEEDIYEEEVQ